MKNYKRFGWLLALFVLAVRPAMAQSNASFQIPPIQKLRVQITGSC